MFGAQALPNDFSRWEPGAWLDMTGVTYKTCLSVGAPNNCSKSLFYLIDQLAQTAQQTALKVPGVTSGRVVTVLDSKCGTSGSGCVSASSLIERFTEYYNGAPKTKAVTGFVVALSRTRGCDAAKAVRGSSYSLPPARTAPSDRHFAAGWGDCASCEKGRLQRLVQRWR